jgi:hypothetical protein
MKHLNRLIVRALAFAIAFAVLLPSAKAGCRHLFHQKVVVVQQVAVPVIYSTVSPYLASEAQTRAIVRDELRQQLNAQPQQQTAAPSILSQRCAVCHNGQKAFDISGNLTAEQYMTFSRMVGLDEYPEGTEAMRPVIAKLKADGKAADVVEAILRQPAARTEPNDGVLQ